MHLEHKDMLSLCIRGRLIRSNDKNIWEYDAVLKTADGHDVPLQFNTMSAAIYPIRNAILIPPENEMFMAKRCRSGSYSGL
jgi:hypothetical protein